MRVDTTSDRAFSAATEIFDSPASTNLFAMCETRARKELGPDGAYQFRNAPNAGARGAHAHVSKRTETARTCSASGRGRSSEKDGPPPMATRAWRCPARAASERALPRCFMLHFECGLLRALWARVRTAEPSSSTAGNTRMFRHVPDRARNTGCQARSPRANRWAMKASTSARPDADSP